MGKFLKITIITIIVFFLILAAVGFVLVKTFDIEAFKPRIIAAAEKSLGRSVQCDAVALDFSWQKGLSLDLVDVAVGEDPDFGSDNFFSAKTIAFSVSLKDFFLKRQIRVLAVEVKSLALVVTRLNDGRLNDQGRRKPPALPRMESQPHPVKAELPPDADTHRPHGGAAACSTERGKAMNAERYETPLLQVADKVTELESNL